MSKSKKQNTLVIVIAVSVVLVSGLLTFAFSSGMFDSASRGQEGFKNVTFTDATLKCEAKVEKEFGKMLSQKVVDNHSSRFENQRNVFKIFLKAYTNKKNRVSEYFVTCIVRGKNGKIAKFEILENKEGPKGEAIKKHSDKLLVWPD